MLPAGGETQKTGTHCRQTSTKTQTGVHTAKLILNMISKITSRSFKLFGLAIQQFSQIGGIQLLVPTATIAKPLEPEPPPFSSHYSKFSQGRNSGAIPCQEFNQENRESKQESTKNREMASNLAQCKLNTMNEIKASKDASWSFLNDQNFPVSKIIRSATIKDSFETTESSIPLLANKIMADAMMPVNSCSEDLPFGFLLLTSQKSLQPIPTSARHPTVGPLTSGARPYT